MKLFIKVRRLVVGYVLGLFGILFYCLLCMLRMSFYGGNDTIKSGEAVIIGLLQVIPFWIPMDIIYGGLVLLISTRCIWINKFPILEINGFILAVLIFFGLWPPYMWVFKSSLFFIVLHLASLFVVNLIIFGFYKLTNTLGGGQKNGRS